MTAMMELTDKGPRRPSSISGWRAARLRRVSPSQQCSSGKVPLKSPQSPHAKPRSYPSAPASDGPWRMLRAARWKDFKVARFRTCLPSPPPPQRHERSAPSRRSPAAFTPPVPLREPATLRRAISRTFTDFNPMLVYKTRGRPAATATTTGGVHVTYRKTTPCAGRSAGRPSRPLATYARTCFAGQRRVHQHGSTSRSSGLSAYHRQRPPIGAHHALNGLGWP
jgi:hypothetical protein